MADAMSAPISGSALPTTGYLGAPNIEKGCIGGVRFESPMLIQAASTEHSFGYDPIFFLPEYNYTVAELSIEIPPTC